MDEAQELVPQTGKLQVKQVRITMLANQGGFTPGTAYRNLMDPSELQVYGK